jgi:bifunctional UDP-N-acetylglucosamine pyrophosphorylase/glucosamine-1-phosphate N-acetyltransferase
LGAGTKIANLRFDDVPVKMSIKGERIDSGRRKLGAIIGYNVKTGINVSIYPGVRISSGTWIEAETLVRKDV